MESRENSTFTEPQRGSGAPSRRRRKGATNATDVPPDGASESSRPGQRARVRPSRSSARIDERSSGSQMITAIAGWRTRATLGRDAPSSFDADTSERAPLRKRRRRSPLSEAGPRRSPMFDVPHVRRRPRGDGGPVRGARGDRRRAVEVHPRAASPPEVRRSEAASRRRRAGPRGECLSSAGFPTTMASATGQSGQRRTTPSWRGVRLAPSDPLNLERFSLALMLHARPVALRSLTVAVLEQLRHRDRQGAEGRPMRGRQSTQPETALGTFTASDCPGIRTVWPRNGPTPGRARSYLRREGRSSLP